jgi:hypothetical protein
MRTRTRTVGAAAVAALLLAVPGPARAETGGETGGGLSAVGEIRAWADEVDDQTLDRLRGTGLGFDMTATFVVTDATSARFDISGGMLPDAVTGTPDVSRLAGGQVQVSTQLSGVAGFSGIGTFVSVNGNHNVTTTNTLVNILYAPNMDAQTALTAFRSLPLRS